MAFMLLCIYATNMSMIWDENTKYYPLWLMGFLRRHSQSIYSHSLGNFPGFDTCKIWGWVQYIQHPQGTLSMDLYPISCCTVWKDVIIKLDIYLSFISLLFSILGPGDAYINGLVQERLNIANALDFLALTHQYVIKCNHWLSKWHVTCYNHFRINKEQSFIKNIPIYLYITNILMSLFNTESAVVW